MSTTFGTRKHHPVRDLRPHLDEWVAESIISKDEAAAIERFETRERPAPERTTTTRPSRFPALTEALAYLGAVLAIAAGAVIIGDRWSDLETWAQQLITGGCTLALFAGGLALRADPQPSFARLASVLWALAVATFAWFVGLVAHDGLGWSERGTLLAWGAAALAFAVALWAVRPRALQQMAMFAAAIATVIAAVWDPVIGPWAVWGVAVAWVGSAAFGRLVPRDVALVTGSLVALGAPVALLGEWSSATWLGLATAVGIVVAGARLRDVAMLALGLLGALGYGISVIADLADGTIVVPVVLLVTGAALLIGAVVIARRGRAPGRTRS